VEDRVDRRSSKFVAALRGDAGALPPGPQGLSDAQAASHRTRLIAGLAEVLTVKRYADITVADVVACAQVSRRTFYGHFPDKDACFLANYEACADLMMEQTARAIVDGADRPYDERTHGLPRLSETATRLVHAALVAGA
jgi:AcrR family transcriptional regulator